MEIQPVAGAKNHAEGSAGSSPSLAAHHQHHHSSNPNLTGNSMQSWWESISRARSRIQSLSAVLGPSSAAAADLAALADSDQPAKSLLDSAGAYAAVSDALSRPSSGSGDDALCQWLYETYQSPDPDLRLVVLSFVPLISGLYLSRVVAGYSSAGAGSPSLAGFEAVLLSLYAAETKARGGKPLLIHVPDLSQPSLYHTTRSSAASGGGGRSPQISAPVQPHPTVGILSPPLEPQTVVKSTKRACIVAVALDCYFKRISVMPSSSKVDLCEFAASWAGEYYSGRDELELFGSFHPPPSPFSDGRALSEDGDEAGNCRTAMERLRIEEKLGGGSPKEGGARVFRGSRIPFPWELLQPVLRILGHCLLAPLNPPEVRDAASVSVRYIYGRVSHDLLPQAILASRSLIQLDQRARETAMAAATASSNPNTPSKPRKPEVLLSSK
ncbi:unnamed protein product [Spirodela intermedia]|uniref:Uncharacterized protein n=1 Tax=Spirodela intermedia TaxID=51605 RepID=A0A7I8J305_SPIIN|nr:unnamed protein product [Spirodela intermedia]CAA6664439.1 unnamed protein product [Spirodela intermedia]